MTSGRNSAHLASSDALYPLTIFISVSTRADIEFTGQGAGRIGNGASKSEMAEFSAAGDLLVTTLNARLTSDSVVMWTRDDRSPGFVSLLIASGGLLAAARQNGIPMRGAVSRGG